MAPAVASMPPALVLDTTAIAGWVFREPDKAPWAEHIIDVVTDGRVLAYVPELFWAEFQQVAGKKVQQGQLVRPQAEQAYLDVAALPLQEVSALVDFRDTAWDLRLGLLVGSYDAYFLALAQDLGIEYWTFDVVFCQLVSAEPNVRAMVKRIGVDVQP